MTGPEFAAAHGDPRTWTPNDIEAQQNLALVHRPCNAAYHAEDRGLVRCTVDTPPPHNDPAYGAYHQAPSQHPGGLTLWLDTATNARRAA